MSLRWTKFGGSKAESAAAMLLSFGLCATAAAATSTTTTTTTTTTFGDASAHYVVVEMGVGNWRILRCSVTANSCEDLFGDFSMASYGSGLDIERQPGGGEVESYLVAESGMPAPIAQILRCSVSDGNCSTIAGRGAGGFTSSDLCDVIPELDPDSGVTRAVLIADCDHQVVRRCPTGGSTCDTVVGSGLIYPRALDIELNPEDGEPQAYIVADQGDHTVRRCPVGTNSCTVVVGTSGEEGQSNLPGDVKLEINPVTRIPEAYIIAELRRVVRCPYGGGPCSTIFESGYPSAVDVETSEDGAVVAYVVADPFSGGIYRCPLPIGGGCDRFGVDFMTPVVVKFEAEPTRTSSTLTATSSTTTSVSSTLTATSTATSLTTTLTTATSTETATSITSTSMTNTSTTWTTTSIQFDGTACARVIWSVIGAAVMMQSLDSD